MRITLAALAILLFSPAALSQSDHFIKWSISHGLSVPHYNSMEFDVNILRKFITLNGALIDSENGHTPATGSCFRLSSGGISCTFSAANRNFDIDTDSNLTGVLTEKDSNGNILGSALIHVSSLI